MFFNSLLGLTAKKSRKLYITGYFSRDGDYYESGIRTLYFYMGGGLVSLLQNSAPTMVASHPTPPIYNAWELL